MTITISEEQRHAILLALAKLAGALPGWHHFLKEIAATMEEDGERSLYDQFLALDRENS